MHAANARLTYGVFITPLHIRFVAADENGKPIGNAVQIPVTSLSDPLQQLVILARHLTKHSERNYPNAKIGAVAVAISGRVNDRRTKITQASRLSSWVGFDIAGTLKRLLGGAHVVLGNDAEARTRWLLANDPSLSAKPFLTLFLGEGIGGSFVKNGVVVDLAPGHIRVPGVSEHNALPCMCGEFGCLDAYSSGTRIAHAFANAGGRSLTDAQWASFADPVAKVIAQLFLLYGVDTIVVGGKRYNDHEQLRDHVYSRLAKITDGEGKVLRTYLEYAPAHTALTLLTQALAAA